MRASPPFGAFHARGLVVVTGATGLLGAAVVRRWALASGGPRLAVIVRDPARWRALAARAGIPAAGIEVHEGDLLSAGLGISADARARLARRATAVVHLAADTTFSRPLAAARLVNVEGTRRLLELADDCPGVERFAFVSTAFAAGRRTGDVPESPAGAADEAVGWANAYEQSKAEGEALVRSTRRDWLVVRPSTVVCDDTTGAVTQHNAVHQALRIFHAGMAAMIPGVEGSTLDAVPGDYAADAIARLALRPALDGATVHLCAGRGAMPLDELLDRTYALWARCAEWRRRGVSVPALGDLATWALFERTVEDTGDERLRRVTRAMTHFLPQLALPKRFATARADALLGHAAPPVRDYWTRMLAHLLDTGWRRAPAPRGAAA